MTSGGYEILEHTADVGIRSWGPSLETVFEQAAWGLAEILGARSPAAGGKERVVTARARDREALLVDLLNELLLIHESEEAAFAGIRVTRLSDSELEASVRIAPLPGEPAGTGVKAATYHRLAVRETNRGAEAEVYLDV